MTAATEAAGRQITVRSESAAMATATGYTKRGVKSGSAEAANGGGGGRPTRTKSTRQSLMGREGIRRGVDEAAKSHAVNGFAKTGLRDDKQNSPAAATTTGRLNHGSEPVRARRNEGRKSTADIL